MRIHANIVIDLLVNSVRDGDMLDVDDVTLTTFLSIVHDIRQFTAKRKQCLVVESDGKVWYGDRSIHVPPNPSRLLGLMIGQGGTASKESLETVTPHVKQCVKDLNDALLEEEVQESVSWNRNKKLYEIS